MQKRKKMNNIFSLFFILFLVLAVFSCDSKRDTDGDLLFGVDDIPVESGSTTHKNIIKIVETLDGESTVIDFNYTSSKISSVHYNSPDFDNQISVNYTGDQITGLTATVTENAETTVTAYNFVYEGSKLVGANAETKLGTELLRKNKITLTYNTSGKLQNVTDITLNPTTNEEMMKNVMDVQFSGENLSLVRNAMTTNPPTQTIVLETRFSNFDANKNPLLTLPVPLKIALGYFVTNAGAMNVPSALSANNFKTFKTLVSGTSTTQNFTYLYDADNYPTKGTSENYVITYTYQ